MSDEQPGSIEEYLHMILVTNMRIYDALLLLVTQNSQEDAEKLIDSFHEKFQYLGPLPFITKEEDDE